MVQKVFVLVIIRTPTEGIKIVVKIHSTWFYLSFSCADPLPPPVSVPVMVEFGRDRVAPSVPGSRGSPEVRDETVPPNSSP